MSRVGTIILIMLCLSGSSGPYGKDEAPKQNQSDGPVFALEGILKTHPKYLFKYYLTGFGNGQECALFEAKDLRDIKPGSRIHVEGRLGTRFHDGGDEENPSPFPRTWFIYMQVETIKVLQEPEPGQEQEAKQIPAHAPQSNDVRIPTGRLGHPLGTYLTIEGVRMEDGKVGTQTLLVDAVNGRKLPEPIGVWVDNVKQPGLPEATRCVIKGYESGKMIGVPSAVAEAENRPLPQAGWQFKTYFIVTTVVEPQSLMKE